MKANNFKKAVSYFAIASAFTMASCQQEDILEEQAPVAAAQTQTQDNRVEGQYIVVFKNSNKSTASLINELVADKEIATGNVGDRIEGRLKGFTGRLTRAQLADLRNNPEVASIESEQIIALGKSNKGGATSPTPTTTTTSTTTTSSTLTAAGTISATLTLKLGETVPAGVATTGYGDGTGKTAWVIDSGIDLNHPDLNIDAARSVSFVTGVTSVQDGYGHGTMVAGIIGAKNNGSGIIGVAANATIVALRVLNDSGAGTLTALIKAVNHVVTYGKAGDVMNISIGAAASTTLDTAIKNAAAKGIYVSIAAGNSSADCSTTSPQRVNATNVYTVSAMDNNKNFYIGSNFGAPVDRAAPGIQVQTTAKGGGYTQGTGTSFAAPHVAGLLLLKGNALGTNGTVVGDRDSWPDPVAKL
jgi:Subtilase family/Peptidase inhibitor I9